MCVCVRSGTGNASEERACRFLPASALVLVLVHRFLLQVSQTFSVETHFEYLRIACVEPVTQAHT
jgi:hypothetical protein